MACGCAKTAATCRELLAGETHLWTFVRVEGVEPTNNAAERALRHAVIWRKISGGTDSEAGSRFVERMLTVVATCRQQEDQRAGVPDPVLSGPSGRASRPFAIPTASTLKHGLMGHWALQRR